MTAPRFPEERAVARALVRLASPRAVLAPLPGGRGFGLFFGTDRRRRPLQRLTAGQIKQLEAEGAIVRDGQGAVFRLTAAGTARAARAAAAPGEAFFAQHGSVIDRVVMDPTGEMRKARGYSPFQALLRLARLRDAQGAPWLAPHEMAAAKRLRADWEAGQAGLMPGSDWTALPRSPNARGPGNAREGALAVGLDARARLERELSLLAPPLRRIVEALCLHEVGLEEFEKSKRWPARSAKIALKLALAQLAAIPGR
jgi:hypothetical protein